MYTHTRTIHVRTHTVRTLYTHVHTSYTQIHTYKYTYTRMHVYTLYPRKTHKHARLTQHTRIHTYHTEADYTHVHMYTRTIHVHTYTRAHTDKTQACVHGAHHLCSRPRRVRPSILAMTRRAVTRRGSHLPAVTPPVSGSIKGGSGATSSAWRPPLGPTPPHPRILKSHSSRAQKDAITAPLVTPWDSWTVLRVDGLAKTWI